MSQEKEEGYIICELCEDTIEYCDGCGEDFKKEKVTVYCAGDADEEALHFCDMACYIDYCSEKYHPTKSKTGKGA